VIVWRACRWYDAYPRLSFALQLLSLAPSSLRSAIDHDLLDFVQQSLPSPSDTSPAHHTARRALVPMKHHRWYDAPGREDVGKAIALLEQSPETIKRQFAERVLHHLDAMGSDINQCMPERLAS
jgi:hypothetical protein